MHRHPFRKCSSFPFDAIQSSQIICSRLFDELESIKHWPLPANEAPSFGAPHWRSAAKKEFQCAAFFFFLIFLGPNVRICFRGNGNNEFSIWNPVSGVSASASQPIQSTIKMSASTSKSNHTSSALVCNPRCNLVVRVVKTACFIEIENHKKCMDQVSVHIYIGRSRSTSGYWTFLITKIRFSSLRHYLFTWFAPLSQVFFFPFGYSETTSAFEHFIYLWCAA